MKFEYRGLNDCYSFCDVSVNNNTVVVSELEDNPGTSVTNAAEIIAEKICRDFNINPEELVYIETRLTEETFYSTDTMLDIVKFDIRDGKFSDPRWRPVSFVD